MKTVVEKIKEALQEQVYSDNESSKENRGYGISQVLWNWTSEAIDLREYSLLGREHIISLFDSLHTVFEKSKSNVMMLESGSDIDSVKFKIEGFSLDNRPPPRIKTIYEFKEWVTGGFQARIGHSVTNKPIHAGYPTP